MEKELFADDRPIARVSEDALGFSKPAESIATSIIDFASPEGFVMGLEGDWGTGKSSFLNLIAGHLKESSTAPEIIQFSPWLISSRNGLLAQFFSEIGRAAQVIAEEAEGTKKDDLQNLSNKGVKSVKSLIDNYSGGLIVLGNIGRLAGLAGIPWASDIGQKVLDFGETAQSLSTDKPLEEQKEEIKEALRSLHRQIVVFIDDLDRLEPKEVGEVVRLVRAVGDFPNIIYVLSYSRPILTRNLAKAFNLKASDPYIDKIVQVTFQVPKPEGFTLRNLFRKRLQSIFPDAFKQDDVSRNNPGLSRLNEAIDKQGGKTLKTPRDVARVLNAMRLYGSSAAEKTDLGDMVWLQMIRVRNPELYDWIESYMGTVGAIINAKGQVKRGEGTRKGQELMKILQTEEDMSEDDIDLYRFKEVIPGLKYSFEEEQKRWEGYRDLSLSNLILFSDDKRLGSPLHYRYYFAFSEPDGVANDDEFNAFISSLRESNATVAKSLKQFAKETSAGSATKLDHYLDRLRNFDVGTLDKAETSNLIIAMGSTMDKVAAEKQLGIWGTNTVWNNSEEIFHKLINTLSSTDRLSLLREVFQSGDAIVWLSMIIRTETFAHGRYGHRQEPESTWNMQPNELDVSINSFVENIKKGDPNRLLTHPDSVNILYAWAQGLKEVGWDEVKEWLEDNWDDDMFFLRLMMVMRGQSTSSTKGTYFTLGPDGNVPHFMDYDNARSRAEKILKNSSGTLFDLASEVVDAFNKGSDRSY